MNELVKTIDELYAAFKTDAELFSSVRAPIWYFGANTDM